MDEPTLVFCCARIHASCFCKMRCQKLGFCYNDMHASMACCHVVSTPACFASPHRVFERRGVWVSGARGLKLDVELAHICATTPPPPMHGNRRIGREGVRACAEAHLAQARGAGARGAGLKTTHSTSSRRLGPGEVRSKHSEDGFAHCSIHGLDDTVFAMLSIKNACTTAAKFGANTIQYYSHCARSVVHETAKERC